MDTFPSKGRLPEGEETKLSSYQQQELPLMGVNASCISPTGSNQQRMMTEETPLVSWLSADVATYSSSSSSSSATTRPLPSPVRSWPFVIFYGSMCLCMVITMSVYSSSHYNIRRKTPSTTPAEWKLGAAFDARLGVCYDPAHHYAYPGNMPQVFSEDFPKIAEHFRVVRTFYATYFGTDVMPYIANAGLKAALGVSIANGRAEEEEGAAIRAYYEHGANGRAEEEKGAAIRAYYEHGGNLASIFVGNEDLIPVGPFTVDDVIGHIQSLRKAGVNVPIGSVQRINEWLSPSKEIDRLAAACDVIGVNVYPYFSSPHNDGEAWELDNQPVENMKKQLWAVMSRFPGQQWKVKMTETGWPTHGSRNFAGHDATIETGEKYYQGWAGWTCSQGSDSYYYTAFDRRSPSSPDYEQYFGVMDADGGPKFGLNNGYC